MPYVTDEGERLRKPHAIAYDTAYLDKLDRRFYEESRTKRKENGMTKFEKGDRVRLIETDHRYRDRIGDTGTIETVHKDATLRVAVDHANGVLHIWHKAYVELIKGTKEVKEKKMSTQTKYYRVVKDHPAFETDAILSNKENDEQYAPVTDVFYKELKSYDLSDSGFYECNDLVENQPEWFERVYPIGKLEKAVFGNKKQAQAAAAAMYKDDK